MAYTFDILEKEFHEDSFFIPGNLYGVRKMISSVQIENNWHTSRLVAQGEVLLFVKSDTFLYPKENFWLGRFDLYFLCINSMLRYSIYFSKESDARKHYVLKRSLFYRI